MRSLLILFAVVIGSGPWAFALSINLNYSHTAEVKDENGKVSVVKTDTNNIRIYYKDGQDIVVKECGRMAVVNTLTDCKSKFETRVAIDLFKKIILNDMLLTPHDLELLSPKNMHQSAPYEYNQQRKVAEAKLAKILKFTDNEKSKCDSASCRQEVADAASELWEIKQKLVKSLPDPDPYPEYIQKMNSKIKDLVDNLIGSSKLTKVSEDSDKATYDLLTQFDASHVECGLDDGNHGPDTPPSSSHSKGGVALNKKRLTSRIPASVLGIGARMNDCAKLPGSVKKADGNTVEWKLVTRRLDPWTGRLYEVWQDSKPTKDGKHSLWTLPLDSWVSADDAPSQCAGPEGRRAAAGVTDKKFILPSEQDFDKAREDGLFDLDLIDVSAYFWTSTKHLLGNQNVYVGHKCVSDYDPDGIAPTNEGCNFVRTSLVMCVAH